MTDLVVRRGQDTWVDFDNPSTPHGSGRHVRLSDATRLGLVLLPLQGLRGRTVLSGQIIGHIAGAAAAQTFEFLAASSGWSAGTATWRNAPGATALSTSVTVGALTDGAEVVADLTTILQSVADGAPWNGLIVNSSIGGDTRFYSFDSGQPSWRIVAVLSDAPEQPTDLAPGGGGAVGTSKPILSWTFADYGGASTDQAQVQVQIDPGLDGVTPDWDSGWLPGVVDPHLDLATTTYPGLTVGDTTAWRSRAKDGAGEVSAWSDWATWMHRTDPVLVMDSPVGGVVGDPTPDVLAHLEGEDLTEWRAWVTEPDDRTDELYDTGLRKPVGGAIDFNVPLRNHDGKRILKDDRPYQLIVRAWGDVDRARCIGHPPYVEQIVTFTFNDDVIERPRHLAVVPYADGDPRQIWSWELDEAAEAYVAYADGEVIDRFTAADVGVDAGIYTWVDKAQATPYKSTDYQLVAINAGRRSPRSTIAPGRTTPHGVWIVDDDEVPIYLNGTVTDNITQTDKRATYTMLQGHREVDIVYGFGKPGGTFEGAIRKLPDGPSVHLLVKTLDSLRRRTSARPRLLWGTRSERVMLRNLSALPSSGFTEDNLEHRVTFGFVTQDD